MAITAADIQLLESERMRDTADGGGRQTGNVIPSGLAGNVFPKVSRIDSVNGRVNLRKIYLAVRSATLDMYAGAHAIITDPPNNDRISCVLFATGSAFDQRSAARNRIESYVVAGPLARMRLYGDQLIGQRAILVYQREEDPLPDVGDVRVLSVEAAGYAAAEQYVRITDVTHEVMTFTDDRGDYARRVLTLKIGSALTQTFRGAEPSRYSTDTSPTKVRVTQVADASHYYGIQPLAEEALAGALTLTLPSVYAPLVPSTQRETAVSLATISGAQWLVAAGAPISSVTESATVGVTTSPAGLPKQTYRRTLLRPILPGTLTGTVRDAPALVLSADNGSGYFSAADGVEMFVDYANASITIWGNALGRAPLAVTYVPAAQGSIPAHTRNVPVTLGSRGTVYAETLSPAPAPGTVVVDFRALGRWYRLRDNGAGQLVANNSSEGTGSIDYATGAVVVTLGALPDVDSAVLFAWGSPAHYTIRAGATVDAGTTLRLSYSLAHAPVVPGSFTASYPVAGVSRTATDASANGVVSGTGVSGTIDYATGTVTLLFSTPPDRAANLANAYTWRDGASLLSGTAATIVSGHFTVPGVAPFRAGGSMVFNASTPLGQIDMPAYITSGGQVRVGAGRVQVPKGRYAWLDQAVGTFNTATGEVTLTANPSISRAMWYLNLQAWQGTPEAATIVGVANIAVERDTAAFSPNAITGEVVSPATIGLLLDLTTTVADPIVAGSIMFRATGKTYVDRNGTIYADVDPATGSGTVAGSISYETGVASLTWWADNAAVNRAVDACLTAYGEWTAGAMYFRTAGSPIRPASFYVQAATPAGDLISATADQNGVVSGNGITGTIEQTMGVVAVDFGQEILPGTLRYSCVVIAHLPLDATLLGLDPVRLPSDGLVPIYRPGDVVVIHHTQETALPNPVVAGQTYSVGRTNLATLRLRGATGVDVVSDRYAVDLVAGTVTIAADWTGAGVVQPLTAVHRIEDMALLADVQINGQVDISAPLSRTYPVPGTYVSSALLFGDLQALVTGVFDQQTWTSVWSDALIGSQATAQYDDINHPIEVVNRSAVTERWRINFTSNTAYQVIGENLGVIATGSTAADCAPINPVTGEAYFVLRSAGWGSGWSAGNQLRFNTVGASGPLWIARTILAGASLAGDSFDLEGRGDLD